MSALVVPERVTIVLRMLINAAERGDECPSNALIACAIDAQSVSTASAVVSLLEEANLIRVWRGKKARVVEIVATGKRTAGEIPHCGSSWSDADDATLMEGVAEDWSWLEIARAVGRTDQACKRRFSILSQQYGAQAA